MRGSRSWDSKPVLDLMLFLHMPPVCDMDKAVLVADEYLSRHGIQENVFLLKCFTRMVYLGGLKKDEIALIVNRRWDRYGDCLQFILADDYNYNKDRDTEAVEIYGELSENNIDLVRCHYRLFKYFKANGKSQFCDLYADRVIRGFRKIYDMDEVRDLFDFENFVNERIKGTHMSKPNFDTVFQDLAGGASVQPEPKLSPQQAYKAMFHFIEHLYELTHEGILQEFLGSMQLLDDGLPADSAYWEDWKKAIQKIML